MGDQIAACRVHYCVAGSEGGIAISKDGSAFARVDLMATTAMDAKEGSAVQMEEAKVAISSLVSLGFASESHLIQSVAWCILKDAAGTSVSETANESKSDSTAKESLESQTVYPSVVSFDEAQRERAKDRLNDAALAERQAAVEQMEDPGMNI